jgi:hypothetical protein
MVYLETLFIYVVLVITGESTDDTRGNYILKCQKPIIKIYINLNKQNIISNIFERVT